MVRKLPIGAANRPGEIRLIGAEGEQLGIMTLRQAMDTAREQNLDVVEVSATSTPPVCRLLDYGRYKYEQARKEREARRGQKTSTVREIRFRPHIDVHDLEAKLRIMHKMLDAGDKIKVGVIFRGRQMAHPENGRKLLQKVVDSLQGKVAIDKLPSMEGRRMIMILSPSRSTKGTTGITEAAKEAENAKT